jgi:hypothetical protein
MPDTKTELRMRLIRKTDMACLVTNKESATDPRIGRIEKWIPRSLMGRTQTTVDQADAKNYPFFTFTLPEWKIEADQLWDYTSS